MESEKLRLEAEALGLNLTPDQLRAFSEFEDALYEAAKVMNLTRVPQSDCWMRHFLDSLLIAPLLPEGTECLDVGCGPGFPCWPLALVRPDTHWTALDSSGKMIGFLAKHRLPNLKPVCERAETWGVRDRFDWVTGRAVAPLAIQLELSAPPCRIGGFVVPMRTPNDREAIATLNPAGLGLELVGTREVLLRPLCAPRLFPIYQKVGSTPERFPRSWAEIRKKPFSGKAGV